VETPRPPVYTITFSEEPTLAPLPECATPAVWFGGALDHPPARIKAVNRSPVALALCDWARHEEQQGRTVRELIDIFRGLHTWVTEGQIPDPDGDLILSEEEDLFLA
jgi:hypothetical protein